MDPQILKNMVDTNTVPYAMLLHFVIPKMAKKARSGIINVSSVGSHWAAKGSCTYAGSKAFDRLFSLSLAGEYSNIDIMALKPLGVETNMLKMKANRKNGVILPIECAQGALGKLGHDLEIFGHWRHDLQGNQILLI